MMFEIDKKKFGAFVSELRREKGFTQKELAEKLFISDKAISKWETGVSIPDTSLLVPLADLFGVTVTELLMCKRMIQEAPLDANQVEAVVQTALSYTEDKTTRAYQTKTKWPIIYFCSVIIGSVGAILNYQQQALSETLITVIVLGIIFGAYFCFMVKTKLPVYYDDNRCGLYYDGPVRMNFSGIAFNNSNWPYIVRVVRIWSCLTIVLSPVINRGMSFLNADFGTKIARYVFLLFGVGGLFISIYIVGKKYE